MDDRRLFCQGLRRLCEYNDETAVFSALAAALHARRCGTARLDEDQGLTWYKTFVPAQCGRATLS